MRVTRVDVKQTFQEDEALLAFISITFDHSLVIHDLRLVERVSGHPILSMPTRKRLERCLQCSEKNPFTAAYCSKCGVSLPIRKLPEDAQKYHDIAFPITQTFRNYVTREVLLAFIRQLPAADTQRYSESWSQILNRAPGIDS